MKRFIAGVMLIFVTAVVAACGSGGDGGGGGDGKPSPIIDDVIDTGYGGDWPHYSGAWKSINPAMGSKYDTWAYLDVTMKDKGTFSGTYRSYVYSHTVDMSTIWGPIPTPVYVPGGTSKEVKGAIDFSNLKGEMIFQGIGRTSFTVDLHSNNELALVFPAGFGYKVANIQR